jgi:AmmeMemoRadiSam system protein B
MNEAINEYRRNRRRSSLNEENLIAETVPSFELAEAIQEGLMRMSGSAIVPVADIEALLGQLDHAFLLESDAFRARKAAVMEDFTRRTVREPQLAGRSYENDPARLRESISQVEASLSALPKGHGEEIAGVLAPHIEIGVARQAYVDAYRRIQGASYDLVVILGINHQGSDGLYCVSGKDYDTPLGTLEADRECVEALKAGLPDGTLAPHDFDHMVEHSIEFQTVFLAHYLGTSTKILPVLCGGFHEFLARGDNPMSDRRFIAFRDALARVIGWSGKKTLVVSGVDFSHVGPKFGHAAPAAALLGSARSSDERIISCLAEGDPGKIWLNALETKDQYNVCGLASMVLFSSLLGRCRAELLHHGTYDEPATRSAVTFASMVFTRPRA